MIFYLLEKSPAAAFLVHFAFYLIPTYFWGLVLKQRCFFLSPLCQACHRGLICITLRRLEASL